MTNHEPLNPVSRWIAYAILGWLFVGWSGRAAPACEYGCVRDAAFEEPRDVHRLCVIGNAEDPIARAIHERLAAWLASSAAGLNVELCRLNADDPQVKWEEYGLPSAPSSLPVVALWGRRTLERTNFFIDHWEPAPTEQELEALKSSPAREAIRQKVGRQLALLLYVPGTDVNAGRAQKVIDTVVKTWAAKQPVGLAVVRANRADQRERLLLSFAGIKPTGPDWVAAVFGRGKFLPSLEGPAITEAALNELIDPLMGECTCLRSASSLGVDIPLIWDKGLDELVVRLRTGGDDAPPKVAASDVLAQSAGRHPWVTTVWTSAVLVAAVALAAAMMWRKSRQVT